MATPQKIAISGASGLVGTDLTLLLESKGHTVVPMSRRKSSGTNTIVWDPSVGVTDPSQLEGLDTIIHLAGENIAGGRWNAAIKERIRSSRVDGTRSLVKSLGAVSNRPKTLICASAIGFYGHRGDEVLNESSRPDQDIWLTSVRHGKPRLLLHRVSGCELFVFESALC